MPAARSQLLSLPAEVLLQVLGNLTPDALYAVSLTCREAYELLEDDDSWPAWRGSYTTLFDDPADSGWPVAPTGPHKDWRQLTHECFRAVRALLNNELGPDTPVVSFLALQHLLHTAPAAGAPSKNLAVLHPRLLPSLLDFPRDHGARPVLAQLVLHLDHLASWAWDKPAEELGAARELVYDLSTYADQPHFGPFQVGFGFSSGDPDDDGGVRVRAVDWDKVNAIAQLMGDNLRSAAEAGDWEGDPDQIPLRAEGARPGSAPPKAGPDDDVVVGDWARISGVWQGGYAFMDHIDFSAFNYPRLTRQSTRMSLDGYDDVVGNMLTLTLAVEPDPDFDPGQRLKPYAFSGSSFNALVGSSSVAGVVTPLYPPTHPSALASFAGPPLEVRLSLTISYGGEARWSLEGVLLEGARGLVGVWTEVDRERRSPCGPTMYWRVGVEGDGSESDEQA